MTAIKKTIKLMNTQYLKYSSAELYYFFIMILI